MPLYTRRRIRSQLCALAVMVALAALPLAGAKLQRAPILAPMGIEPVPLGAGLQMPPGSPLQLPSLLAPGRLVLGLSPSPVPAPNLYTGSRLHITNSGFRDLQATYRPNGRSPPSA